MPPDTMMRAEEFTFNKQILSPSEATIPTFFSPLLHSHCLRWMIFGSNFWYTGITGIQCPETHLCFQFLCFSFYLPLHASILDMFNKSYILRRMGVGSMNTTRTGKEFGREQAVWFKFINSREVPLRRISLAWSVLTPCSVHIILHWLSKEKQIQHQFFCERNPASSNHPPSQSPSILYPTAIPIPEDDLHTKFSNDNSQVNDYCVDNSQRSWSALITPI